MSSLRIQVLPPLLVNQIAAGEVVERPAAVVKECLENSIDAGATSLSIVLLGGGLKKISITDNGRGIHADDLPLAIHSHATSKIQNVEDLAAIASLGFRGEALASISAVSRFRLISRTKDAEQAYQISVHLDDDLVKPAAHSVGTTVEVTDLFFNTPARRKFLRTARTEFLQVDAVVRRIALSRMDLAIRFWHDSREIFHLTPASTEEEKLKRLQKIFNKGFVDHLRWVDAAASGLRLHGWIANPEFLRSSNDFQYFYLNGRMVRDKLLNHAVKQAFEGVLYPGRQASYCLYLECDPSDVDVNVHPTKHEVRFRHARLVHDFVYSQCRTSEPQVMAETSYVQYASPALKIREPSAHVHTPFGRCLGVVENRICFTHSEEAFFIVNLIAAEREMLYQEFLVTESLGRRPLLVPVRVKAKQISPLLSTLGLEVDWLGQETAVVRTIPIALPQLDLNAFFASITAEDLSREQFIRLLLQHHDFTIQPRSPEVILQELSTRNWREKNYDGKVIVKETATHQLETLLHD